jgi:hypothetical protein
VKQSTPVLAQADQVAIGNSLAMACGVNALRLILNSMEPEDSKRLVNNLMGTWRNAWKEAFQGTINEYSLILNQVSDTSKMMAPEDLQVAFNHCIAETEKVGRDSLRTEEEK